MPNECDNYITIITYHNQEELENLITNELERVEENVSMYNVYKDNVRMVKRGKKGIIFHTTSSWNPNYDWLEGMLDKYPNCRIKNEWIEEGGIAGVWVGYVNNDNNKIIKNMSWNDMSIESRHYLFLQDDEKIEIQKEIQEEVQNDF